MDIKKIILEEIDDFDWAKEHKVDPKEIIQFITDNQIEVWNFGEYFEGDINFYNKKSSLKSLGNLKTVKGNIDLSESPLEDLGELTRVDGFLNLDKTKLKSLGNLEHVSGFLGLYSVDIKDFGDLKSVGDFLLITDTKIPYTEDEIREIVHVGGTIYGVVK